MSSTMPTTPTIKFALPIPVTPPPALTLTLPPVPTTPALTDDTSSCLSTPSTPPSSPPSTPVPFSSTFPRITPLPPPLPIAPALPATTTATPTTITTTSTNTTTTTTTTTATTVPSVTTAVNAIAAAAATAAATAAAARHPHHWRPATTRLAALMDEAKQQARARHADLQARKALRKRPDARKRRRVMTTREVSSLISAEVCREKFAIYPNLLEREVAFEEEEYMQLLSKLLEQTAANIELERRISEAKNRLVTREKRMGRCKSENEEMSVNDGESPLVKMGEMSDPWDRFVEDDHDDVVCKDDDSAQTMLPVVVDREVELPEQWGGMSEEHIATMCVSDSGISLGEELRNFDLAA